MDSYRTTGSGLGSDSPEDGKESAASFTSCDESATTARNLVRQKRTMTNLTSDPKGYRDLLALLTTRIRTGIGKEILIRQREDGWGTKVIERLANDLRREFPDMQGLSPRNLGYMKAFAEAWPDEAILQAPLAKLTWYHNITLIQKVKERDERLWYAHAAVQQGWSRNVLVLQIESQLYRRQGKALANFQQALPPPQSDLAQQITKDPYNFDFLTLRPRRVKRTWRQASWNISGSFSSNSGWDSPLSAASIH
jgi:predicted nuclease of restriction endonuclease-like (RecB) superfamily